MFLEVHSFVSGSHRWININQIQQMFIYHGEGDKPRTRLQFAASYSGTREVADYIEVRETPADIFTQMRAKGLAA